MNISPSDTDVRQGYSLAGSAAGAAAGAETQDAAGTTESSSAVAAETKDARSQEAAAGADRTAAKEAAQRLQEQLNQTDTGLKIRVLDDEKNSVQVEVVDEKSKKVLRKIPQDEVLKLSASIKELSGFLVNRPA